jgi:hypothetical protein
VTSEVQVLLWGRKCKKRYVIVVLTKMRMMWVCALAALVGSCAIAMSEDDTSNWVMVTQPVLICFAMDQNYQKSAIQSVIDRATAVKSGEPVPLGCWKIKVGSRLRLSGQQIERVVKFDYLLAAEVGAAPSWWTFYGPSEDWFGKYLQPIDPPKSLPGFNKS